MTSPRSRSRFNSSLTRIISVHALNSTDIATLFSWNKSLANCFISTGQIRLIGCRKWAHFSTAIFKIFFMKYLQTKFQKIFNTFTIVSHKVFFCWIAKVSKVSSSLVLTSIQNTPKYMECLHSFWSNKYNWGHRTIGTQLLRHWSIYTVR